MVNKLSTRKQLSIGSLILKEFKKTMEVNYAATLKGLQLGIINIIGEGDFLPVFPQFNFDFD